MEKRPFFSVIIPIYNAEKTLAEAVHSVLAQTFADFEILLVDDASTDGSREYRWCCCRRMPEPAGREMPESGVPGANI